LGRVLSSGAPRRKMVESDDAFASAKKAALALPRYLLQLYPHLLMNTSVTHLRSRVQIFVMTARCITNDWIAFQLRLTSPWSLAHLVLMSHPIEVGTCTSASSASDAGNEATIFLYN
jgi:hypothetical protein